MIRMQLEFQESTKGWLQRGHVRKHHTMRKQNIFHSEVEPHLQCIWPCGEYWTNGIRRWNAKTKIDIPALTPQFTQTTMEFMTVKSTKRLVICIHELDDHVVVYEY